MYTRYRRAADICGVGAAIRLGGDHNEDEEEDDDEDDDAMPQGRRTGPHRARRRPVASLLVRSQRWDDEVVVDAS